MSSNHKLNWCKKDKMIQIQCFYIHDHKAKLHCLIRRLSLISIILQQISIYILYTPYKNIHLSSKYRLCQPESGLTRKSAEGQWKCFTFIKTWTFHKTLLPLCVWADQHWWNSFTFITFIQIVTHLCWNISHFCLFLANLPNKAEKWNWNKVQKLELWRKVL